MVRVHLAQDGGHARHIVTLAESSWVRGCRAGTRRAVYPSPPPRLCCPGGPACSPALLSSACALLLLLCFWGGTEVRPTTLQQGTRAEAFASINLWILR